MCALRDPPRFHCGLAAGLSCLGRPFLCGGQGGGCHFDLGRNDFLRGPARASFFHSASCFYASSELSHVVTCLLPSPLCDLVWGVYISSFFFVCELFLDLWVVASFLVTRAVALKPLGGGAFWDPGARNALRGS